jgi:hypothetical protein
MIINIVKAKENRYNIYIYYDIGTGDHGQTLLSTLLETALGLLVTRSCSKDMYLQQIEEC